MSSPSESTTATTAAFCNCAAFSTMRSTVCLASRSMAGSVLIEGKDTGICGIERGSGAGPEPERVAFRLRDSCVGLLEVQSQTELNQTVDEHHHAGGLGLVPDCQQGWNNLENQLSRKLDQTALG